MTETMQRPRGTTFFIIAGAVFGPYIIWLHFLFFGDVAKTNCLLALPAVVLITWGMWGLKRWALWLSWVLATMALVPAPPMVFFGWAFGVFTLPFASGRQAIDAFQFILLIAWPILWLVYFSRRSIRAKFR